MSECKRWWRSWRTGQRRSNLVSEFEVFNWILLNTVNEFYIKVVCGSISTFPDTNVYTTLPLSKEVEKKQETYIPPEESSYLGNASTDCWTLGKNKVIFISKQLKCHDWNVSVHSHWTFFLCVNVGLHFLSSPSLLAISYMVKRRFLQEA